MKLRLIFFYIALFVSTLSIGQIPPNYYDNAAGKQGLLLKQALHGIIDNHTSVSYGSLHTHYKVTDKKPNGKVWDMYSDIPGGTPPYEFTFITDKCGSYSVEGDCYNREHSFPQSWFNKKAPMKSDLFHVYPTDGKVNGMRSSYPYGEVSNPTKTSQNGCKLGPNTTAGYSGKVFEPLDEYKGDFARTYFYMATRYYGEDGSWKNNAMVNGAEPKLWALNMLYQWHTQDTVSTKEINRNNAVYGIQHNRNPFIDHPEWVAKVWFPTISIDRSKELLASYFPNPANNKITIIIDNSSTKYNVNIIDISGRLIINTSINSNYSSIDISELANGIYIMKISNSDKQQKTLKLIKR